MGISREDVQLMIDQGLLESGPGAPAPAAAAPADGAEVQVDGTGRTQRERYQAAYPIATELTASLGLKGFRLNLAVEGAAGYEDLAALAPKIREAVGDAKYTRLERALFA